MVRQPLNLFASLRLTQGLWYIRGLFVGPMCVFSKNPQSKDPFELLAHSPHDLKAQQHNQSLLRRSCLTSPHFTEGCENYKEPLSVHLFSITTNSALTVAEAIHGQFTLSVGGIWNNQRKPTQAPEEHANSAERGPGRG